MTKLIENEPESQSWLEGRARRRRERIKSERAFLRAKQQHRETQQKFRIGGLIPWVFSPRVCPPLGRRSIKNTDQVVFHTLFVSFCRFVCITLSLYYERKTGEYSLRMKMRSNRVTH